MLVRFKQDFRGKVTREMFYTAGTVTDFDDATAAALLAEGRVEVFEPAPAPPTPAAPAKRKPARSSDGGVL